MNSNDYFVSEKAVIGQNVRIGKGAIIYDNVQIGHNCFIGPYVTIGEPTMGFYRNSEHQNKKTVIGANSIIRSHTVIYEDVEIGEYFQSGHSAIIREQSKIGHHTSFGSSSELPGKATIGNFVRIHSNVMLSENNQIDDYVWIFPFVVLTNSKYPPHGNLMTCHIKQYAQIFSSAILLPGLTIGENAIVGAGALVTKNVEDNALVIGYPAKSVKDVRELRDDDGNPVYPWRDHLRDYRGYPWQTEPI